MSAILRSRRHLVLLSLVASAALAAAAALIQPILARSPVPALELTPFSLAVALSASLGGLGPGLLALAVATAAIHRVAPFSLMELAFLAPWAVFCVVADRLHREHEQERQRCELAEGEAAQASRLAQLTAALSHARTHAAAIEAALQEPLHALAADAGFVLLVNPDGTPGAVPRAVGYSDAERIAREAPPRTKTPAVVAIGRGAPVIVASAEAYAAEVRPLSDYDLVVRNGVSGTAAGGQPCDRRRAARVPPPPPPDRGRPAVHRCAGTTRGAGARSHT